MIDLHLHILPGVDDGARNDEEARAMLAYMAGIGYRKVVATPHLMSPLTDEYRLRVEFELERLRPFAEAGGLEIALGYEHMIEPRLCGRILHGEPTTLAGSSAVLVELPFLGWSYDADRYLFELETAGLRPVLAHPERYVEVHRNLDLALALAARGVVLQLTIASFAGTYGKAVRDSARHLLGAALEAGALVVLATDAHSVGQRLTSVAEGLRWIERHYAQGDQIAQWATSVLPAALLANEPLPGFEDWLATHPAPVESRGRRRRVSLARTLNPFGRQGAGGRRPAPPVE